MDAQILNDILSVFTGSIDGAIAVLVGIGLSLFGILALISYYQRYATTVLYGLRHEVARVAVMPSLGRT